MYKILKDHPGSPDGCRVIDFIKGQEVDIGPDFSESLAKVSVLNGWAVFIAHKLPSKRKAKKR